MDLADRHRHGAALALSYGADTDRRAAESAASTTTANSTAVAYVTKDLTAYPSRGQTFSAHFSFAPGSAAPPPTATQNTTSYVTVFGGSTTGGTANLEVRYRRSHDGHRAVRPLHEDGGERPVTCTYSPTTASRTVADRRDLQRRGQLHGRYGVTQTLVVNGVTAVTLTNNNTNAARTIGVRPARGGGSRQRGRHIHHVRLVRVGAVRLLIGSTEMTEIRTAPSRGVALGAAVALVTAALLGTAYLARPSSRQRRREQPMPTSRSMESKTGIRILSAHVEGDGGIIDVRYQVLDPNKANVVEGDPTNTPALMPDGTTTR